jgi:hypothetical protein
MKMPKVVLLLQEATLIKEVPPLKKAKKKKVRSCYFL